MSYSTPIKKRKVDHTSLSCSELSSFLDSLIQFKYIPNCLHALGFLVQSDINKDAVNLLKHFLIILASTKIVMPKRVFVEFNMKLKVSNRNIVCW